MLAVIEEGPDILRAAARAYTLADFWDRVADLTLTLDLLATGSQAGSTGPPPGRSTWTLPSSAWTSAGSAPQGTSLTAAMLCVWSYGFAMVDAAALAEQQLAPRRSYLAVMDELWRALRGARGWSSTPTASPG